MKQMFAVGFLVVAIGCQRPAVEWQEPQTAVARPEPADTAPHEPRLSTETFTVAVHGDVRAMCPESIRSTTVVRGAAGSTSTKYMVWWSMRKDSTAALLLSRSDDDGKTWPSPAVVDSGDTSPSGCNRPPPAVAAVGDYVYVAYSMQASEGAGVFETHSMDGGKTFHSTVPVMYGDRVVNVAIAANSQFVAVAYEEPNGTRHRVAVAISRSQGHLFEGQAIASTDVEPAYLPDVSLSGGQINVTWFTKPVCSAETCTRVERAGRIT